jgi:YidC/Oxa1 family membrane protein insertase
VHTIWVAGIVHPLTIVLGGLYHAFGGVPPLQAVGAYGLAIIALTLGFRLIVSPLYHLQMTKAKALITKRNEVMPIMNKELEALKKKYKNDPGALSSAQFQLYQKHGMNPLSQMGGCLPIMVQYPVLIALYWVFQQFTAPDTHFLFLPSLHDQPSHHPLLPGLPYIPDVAYIIIPLLLVASTWVQMKMVQQPPNPLATEQELQAAQMTKQMSLMMPVMLGFFTLYSPAALGLYWFVSNCVTIIQQYFVYGWGQLWGPK